MRIRAASNPWRAHGKHGLFSVLARRHDQLALVEPRTAARLCPEDFILGDVIDHTGQQLSFALQANRHRIVRLAVQEVQRAIQRVDNEAVRLVRSLNHAALFHQEAIARASLCQAVIDDLLGAVVGIGNEIGRALLGHLQVFDFPEVARKRAARSTGCGNHHGSDGRGFGHSVSLFSQRV